MFKAASLTFSKFSLKVNLSGVCIFNHHDLFTPIDWLMFLTDMPQHIPSKSSSPEHDKVLFQVSIKHASTSELIRYSRGKTYTKSAN